MKRFTFLFCSIILVLVITGMGNATLWDRGGGMIYDDALGITWLQDANYAMTSGYDLDGRMPWDDAVSWADTLIYGGYDNWRLPTTVDGRYEDGDDGTTTGGTNITSSEMGYMFYVNLGNLGYRALDGTPVPDGDYGLNNTGPFVNLQNAGYWSGTEYAYNEFVTWYFENYAGWQGQDVKLAAYYAWAVRPGDVAPVPEPATILLLGTGLIGIAGIGRKKFKK